MFSCSFSSSDQAPFSPVSVTASPLLLSEPLPLPAVLCSVLSMLRSPSSALRSLLVEFSPAGLV